jgi:hypothetical protein
VQTASRGDRILMRVGVSGAVFAHVFGEANLMRRPMMDWLP